MKKSGLFFVMTLLFVSCNKNSPISPTPSDQSPPLTGLVSFTFDDNRSCVIQNAMPALDAAGFKSTNYIITKRLLGTDDYMSGQDVLGLEARGHEIGSHTRTHQDLTLLTAAQVFDEIVESKRDLLSLGVKVVETMSYPFGSYNQSIEKVLLDSGYVGARCSNSGTNTTTTNKFELRRENLGGNVSIGQVNSWLDSANQERSWLILVFHHVDNVPGDYSITPDLFFQIVNKVAEKKMKVVTVREGIGLMK